MPALFVVVYGIASAVLASIEKDFFADAEVSTQ